MGLGEYVRRPCCLWCPLASFLLATHQVDQTAVASPCGIGDGELAIEWLRIHNGSVSGAARVAAAGHGERGVFANENLGKGEVLARVPRAAVFTASAACEKQESSWEQALQAEVGEGTYVGADILALCLLHVCQGGAAHAKIPFSELLAALPELLALENIPLVQASRHGDSSAWGSLAEDVDVELTRLSRIRTLAGTGIDDSDLVLWALAVASSHSHAMPVGFLGDVLPALVPLLDLLNHCPEPNTEIKSGTDSEALLVTSRVIVVGEELCVTYGPSSQRSYLLQYGFLAEDQRSMVSLACPLPASRSAREAVTKFFQLTEQPVDSSLTIELSCDPVVIPDLTDALGYFRLAALNVEDDAGLPPGCNGDLDEGASWILDGLPPPAPRCTRMISAENERRAMELLHVTVHAALQNLRAPRPAQGAPASTIKGEAVIVVSSEIACATAALAALSAASPAVADDLPFAGGHLAFLGLFVVSGLTLLLRAVRAFKARTLDLMEEKKV